jgi:electron transport complex protein RnfC
MPLIERSLTISGGAVEKPVNIRVPVGTIVSDLMPDVFKLKDAESSEATADSAVKIISGGPMMGFAMMSADFPVAKGTSGVTFLTEKETFLEEESQCISCGSCVAKCAMRLSPALIVRELKAGNLDKAKSFGLMDCIECGCCAFVCPAKVNLIQRIRLGKGLVRQKMAEEKAKAQAKAAKEGGK